MATTKRTLKTKNVPKVDDPPKPTRGKGRPKNLALREYYLGIIYGALITRSTGMLNEDQMTDIKKEANRWADFMLEE